MGDLIKDLERFGDLTSSFTLLDVVVVFALSFALSLMIGWVYRGTHRGVSYSQSYVQTLVIFCVVVAFIMLIIGSNIARAFTLVGALSIIRFRHAVKEPRDIAFVFMAMAIGMACGTRFYALAVFATLALSGAVVLMHRLGLFARVVRERILIVRLPSDVDYETQLAEVFREYLDEFSLISMEAVGDANFQELVYSVVLKPSSDPTRFVEAVRSVSQNSKVSLVLGQQEIDL